MTYPDHYQLPWEGVALPTGTLWVLTTDDTPQLRVSIERDDEWADDAVSLTMKLERDLTAAEDPWHTWGTCWVENWESAQDEVIERLKLYAPELLAELLGVVAEAREAANKAAALGADKTPGDEECLDLDGYPLDPPWKLGMAGQWFRDLDGYRLRVVDLGMCWRAIATSNLGADDEDTVYLATFADAQDAARTVELWVRANPLTVKDVDPINADPLEDSGLLKAFPVRRTDTAWGTDHLHASAVGVTHDAVTVHAVRIPAHPDTESARGDWWEVSTFIDGAEVSRFEADGDAVTVARFVRREAARYSA